MYELKVKDGILRAHLQQAPGFPSVAYMWSFGFINTVIRPVITAADAESFLKGFLNQVRATSLVFADIDGNGMHRYITLHLKDAFNAVLVNNKKVTARITRSKKYTNLNSGSVVKEVRLDFTDGWTKDLPVLGEVV